MAARVHKVCEPGKIDFINTCDDKRKIEEDHGSFVGLFYLFLITFVKVLKCYEYF